MERRLSVERVAESRVKADFAAMLAYIDQSRTAIYPSYRKMGRRKAKDMATQLLLSPNSDREIMVNEFKELPLTQAKDAYRTFLLTGLLHYQRLRALLDLPAQGPIFPPNRAIKS